MTLDYFKDMVFPDTFKELTDNKVTINFTEERETTTLNKYNTFIDSMQQAIDLTNKNKNVTDVKVKKTNKKKKVKVSPLMANLLSKLK